MRGLKSKRVLLALELNVETTLVGNAVLSRRSRLVDVQIPGVLDALVSRAEQYSRRSVDRRSTKSMRTILLSSEIEMQYFRYKPIIKLYKKNPWLTVRNADPAGLKGEPAHAPDGSMSASICQAS